VSNVLQIPTNDAPKALFLRARRCREVYQAALWPHQDAPLGAQALAALWKRFCRCRRGLLRDGWKWAWQDLVDDGCRAVALWEQRRAKTLKIIEAGKAAKEAARVRKLSPAERQSAGRSEYRRCSIAGIRRDTKTGCGISPELTCVWSDRRRRPSNPCQWCLLAGEASPQNDLTSSAF
jgi:hypothetical protein